MYEGNNSPSCRTHINERTAKLENITTNHSFGRELCSSLVQDDTAFKFGSLKRSRSRNQPLKNLDGSPLIGIAPFTADLRHNLEISTERLELATCSTGIDEQRL